MATRALYLHAQHASRRLYTSSLHPHCLPGRSIHFSAPLLAPVDYVSEHLEAVETTRKEKEAELKQFRERLKPLQGRKCLVRSQLVPGDEEQQKADEIRRGKLKAHLSNWERWRMYAEDELADAEQWVESLGNEKERQEAWDRFSAVENSSELAHVRLSERDEAELSMLARRTGLSRQEILLGMIWLAPAAYYPCDDPDAYLDEWLGPSGGLAEGPKILQGFRKALEDSDWTSSALLHGVWWSVVFWMLPSPVVPPQREPPCAAPFPKGEPRADVLKDRHIIDKMLKEERGADGKLIMKKREEADT